MNLAVRFRERLQQVSPVLADEFDGLIAGIVAAWNREHRPDNTHSLITADGLRTRVSDPLLVDCGLRYRSGPWIFEDDGDVIGSAVLRPPALTADVNDYAPTGFRDAIVLELDATADVRITGLSIGVQVGGRRKRLVVLVNRSQRKITLVHESDASQPQHRFSLGNNADYEMAPGVGAWLYYDTKSQRWRPFGIPGAAPDLGAKGTAVPHFLRKSSPAWVAARANAIYNTMGPTLSVGGTASTVADTTGYWHRRTSAATAGANASLSAIVAQVQMYPELQCVIKTTANMAQQRFWVGLADRSPADADDPGTAGAFALFRYSTVAGDTAWQAIVDNGTNQQSATTGVTVSANTVYQMRVRRRADGAWVFTVNGSAEVVLTLGLTETAEVGPYLHLYTREAVAKAFDFKYMVVEFGS